jgi:hypothetical protein
LTLLNARPVIPGFARPVIAGLIRNPWLLGLWPSHFMPAWLAAKPHAGGLRRAVSPFRAFGKARNRRR